MYRLKGFDYTTLIFIGWAMSMGILLVGVFLVPPILDRTHPKPIEQQKLERKWEVEDKYIRQCGNGGGTADVTVEPWSCSFPTVKG